MELNSQLEKRCLFITHLAVAAVESLFVRA